MREGRGLESKATLAFQSSRFLPAPLAQLVRPGTLNPKIERTNPYWSFVLYKHSKTFYTEVQKLCYFILCLHGVFYINLISIPCGYYLRECWFYIIGVQWSPGDSNPHPIASLGRIPWFHGIIHINSRLQSRDITGNFAHRIAKKSREILVICYQGMYPCDTNTIGNHHIKLIYYIKIQFYVWIYIRQDVDILVVTNTRLSYQYLQIY